MEMSKQNVNRGLVNIKIALFSLLIIFGGSTALLGKDYVLKSPDKNYRITVTVDDAGKLTYSVTYKGTVVILPSSMGLMTEDSLMFGDNVSVISLDRKSHKGVWTPVYGERESYTDKYSQFVLKLNEIETGYNTTLFFRAYNEGVAFRYRISNPNDSDTLRIKEELSEFALPGNTKAWVTVGAQGKISEMAVEELHQCAERPLVLQEESGMFVAIGEAAMVDFARMKFGKVDGRNSLKACLAGSVKLPFPASTPWRFIMAGTKIGDILENNYLLQNLNKPNELSDVSWIKPGKVIREVTLTTQGGKACVDFAVKHNLQYVEFDAGWYGYEYNDSSDATTITLDPRRSKGPFDLHEIISYGKEKNIGVILYVNRRAMLKQLDDILPLYEKWGVKGVKYGFVGVGSQYWTDWLHDAIRKAAEHNLMVDVHDEYRPTGYERTYPNFMTCEGIRGDEESPSNEHTLKTMFTRTIAGAADNTVCYFAPRVTEKMGGHASQLAKTVCIYSPWQFLYWYDRPDMIGDEPELEFFDSVPTVWDDKVVVEGEIGKYGTIARRSGDEWYIGSINGAEQHVVNISLGFLKRGEKYIATVYSDDPNVDTPTHVKIDTISVNRKSELSYTLKPNTGLAIRIVPKH